MQTGQRITGKYRLLRVIGDGGMGIVYEARHEVLGTSVALKFLHAELASKPNIASRFLREARVSATIRSPHVTQVTDVDTTPDGVPFLVMELLDGESLQAYLQRLERVPVSEAVGIMAQILLGLEAAHALGVVHRDLKPENVFLCGSRYNQVAKLLDFGVAKVKETSSIALDEKGLTRPGALMGTPEYMAPEQMFGAEHVDHRADLFSAGVILYEMLGGRRPVDGNSPHEIVSRVAAGHVTALREVASDVPEPLAALVHRAMHPSRDQRFPTTAAMRNALAAFSEGVDVVGRHALDAPPSVLAPDLARVVQGSGATPGYPGTEETVRSADEEPAAGRASARSDEGPVHHEVRACTPQPIPRTAAAPAVHLAPGVPALGSAALARHRGSGSTVALPATKEPVPAPRATAADWQRTEGYLRPPSPAGPHFDPAPRPPGVHHEGGQYQAGYHQAGAQYTRPHVRRSRVTAAQWLAMGLLAFGAALVVTLVLLIQSRHRGGDDDMPPLPRSLQEEVSGGDHDPVMIAPEGLNPDGPAPLLAPTAEAAAPEASAGPPPPSTSGGANASTKDAGTDAGTTTVILVPTPWPLPTTIPTEFPLPTWPPAKSK